MQAQGNPEPEYRWTRLGSDLPVGNSAVLSLVSSEVILSQYWHLYLGYHEPVLVQVLVFAFKAIMSQYNKY